MKPCKVKNNAFTNDTLYTFRGHCEEEFVWRICLQTISALKECHNRSKLGKTVLHRDLKPANVFLDSNKNVKLGDFGLARVLNHDTSFAKTFVGTPYYMSPVSMYFYIYFSWFNFVVYNAMAFLYSKIHNLCVMSKLHENFKTSGSSCRNVHMFDAKLNSQVVRY